MLGCDIKGINYHADFVRIQFSYNGGSEWRVSQRVRAGLRAIKPVSYIKL